MLVQMLVVPFIAIEKIIPDIVIIFVVYVALKNGQISGTIVGFIFGLLVDLTIDFVLGLSALSKTFAGFVAGYFYSEPKIFINTKTLRFSVIVAVASIVDGIVYFFISLFGGDLGVKGFLRLVVGKTVYTFVLSLIYVFATSKRLD